MNKIILSSGITGIDWSQSINVLVAACSNMSHVDNVMLNTKGKYDDLVFEKTEINVDHKNLKSQFKGYLTRLLKKEKSQISFVSDPVFLDSGAAWQALNSDKTFAFFFCSPEYYLAKMKDATGDGENIDPQEHLNNWLEAATKIWAFYVRYPDATVLINIEDVARDPRSNACKVFEFLGCELDDADNKQATPIAAAMVNPLEALASLLLQNMQLETIKASGELNELYENLAVTAILAENELSYDASERVGIRLSECHKLIAQLSTCQAQLESESASISATNAELILDNQQLVGWRSEFEAKNVKLTTLNNQAEIRIVQLVTQHSQVQEELAAAHLNAQALKGESAAHTLALETSLSELTSENELSLLQINQLQSEREEEFEKSIEVLACNATLRTDISEMSNKLEESNKKQKDDAHWRGKNKHWAETLFAEKKQLVEKSERMEQENKLNLEKIFQVQNEMETFHLQAIKLEEATANIARLAERNSQILTSNDTLQKSLTISENETSELQLTTDKLASAHGLALAQIRQLQAEFESLFADLENYTNINQQLESKNSDSNSDTYLLKTQIGRLQDELEHYLHKCQKMTYVMYQEGGYKSDASRLKDSFYLMNLCN